MQGERVYCRSCGSAAQIESMQAGDIRIADTGQMGVPAQLEPEIDEALVDELSSLAALARSDGFRSDDPKPAPHQRCRKPGPCHRRGVLHARPVAGVPAAAHLAHP